MRKSSLYFLPVRELLNFAKFMRLFPIGCSLFTENVYLCTPLESVGAELSVHERAPPGGKTPIKTIKAMYAIVEIQGQQFKAEQGKKLFVHHIKDAEQGKTVEFDKVLLVDADGAVKVGAPTVEGAKVVCEVVNPLVKGDKVIVFKMKRRKDSRTRNGHREQFTEVEIKSVIA